MNKFKFIAVALSVLCTACVKDIDAPQEEILVPHEYVVSLDSSTKTSADAAGKLSWNAGDVVRYYSSANGTVGSASVPEAGSSASLTMNIATGAKFLVAVYGGTGVSQNTSGNAFVLDGAVTAEQSGKFEDAHIAVAKTYDINSKSLKFVNVTSLIRFTLERTDVAYAVFKSNDGSVLHGDGTLKFTFSDENHSASFEGNAGNSIKVTVGNSGTFYISTLACTMAEGFTMSLYKADYSFIGKVSTDKSVALAKNKILNLGTLDSRIETHDPTKPDIKYEPNLSLKGTANCYIVPIAGEYYFDATVKGGNTEKISGSGFEASVLWESFGTDVQPQVGDIITDCHYENGKIYFKVTGADGNAVIALTDRDDDVVWSWHIWCCMGYDADFYAQEYYNNAGTVMDRNLGATSATKGDVKALGLLYQWGRKDPFLSGQSISSTTHAKSTTTWPSPVKSDANNGTIDYVVKHPTTFVKYNSNNYDWYYTDSGSTDNTRWNSGKGIYDPCPKGWRVPDGGSNGLWAKAFGSSSDFSGPWDSTNKGMDFAGKFSASSEVWYPASGFLIFYDVTPCNVGDAGDYWSCTPNGEGAYYLTFVISGYVAPSYYDYRAFGRSVRCVKEETTPEPEPEAKNLSADGTANCYIVNEYGPCKFDATKKGHTSESVGTIASAEVLWESFGNDVQPIVGDIVKDVAVKNGIVSFTASGKDGNAVIAVKNAAGDILWSWHIWVCQGFDPAATAQVYNNNAGTVMDRNLGATSAKKGDVKALGLLYQWGRKDPFLSGQSISSTTHAKSTTTWPSPVKSDANNGTIDYVVKHPTTFVTYNSSNYDWYYTGSSSTDNTRWNSSKGMYDPCPKGWKVPDGGSNGLWAKAFGTSYLITSSNWDSTNMGMDFGSIDKGEKWYPASGGLNLNDGTLSGVGYGGSDWSCTPSGYLAYSLLFDNNGYVIPSSESNRAFGRSVRCVKEETTPEPEPEAKDLSADGTANCYIVSEYGPCKFDATKKGHTSESVGTIASAEVLWESFGNDVQPTVGDIVKDVAVKNGIVSFTASGKDGNAAIAVKDAVGDILWSWHIWVCKGFDPAATAQVYYNNAGTMMDRNLGATSAAKGDVKALGLLYQWGRKDPFLSGQLINSNARAKSTITWPSTVSSNSSNGTIDYVVKHPTTFVKYNSSNYDWYYTGSSSTDNTRWNSNKGMYDPCPKGWRVPDGGSNDLWAEALGSSSLFSGGPWDSTNKGMDFAGKFSAASEVWYPASGFLDRIDGSLYDVGYTGCYWSCTPNGYNAYVPCFGDPGDVDPSGYSDRAYGLSVRCVKQ